MALGDVYATQSELAAYLGITLTKDNALMEAAVLSATAWVTDHCGRDFQKTLAPSTRTYAASDPWRVHTDDFHTLTDLAVTIDNSDDGTFDEVWTLIDDFVVRPLDGIEGGATGFPYRTLLAVGGRWFPRSMRARVQVTAQWGWTAVPAKVRQATLILAAELYRLKDAPLGVAASNEFGPLRVREIPQVKSLLAQFQRPDRSGPQVA